MVVVSFPPQMGVCLATDQRLTTSNSTEKDDDCSGQPLESIPEVLRIGNLRHVAPYFIEKELSVGKLARGETVGQALAMDDFPITKEKKSIVKNVSFVDWWPKELLAGRLMIINHDQNQQCQESVATPDHLIVEGDVLRGRYHFHEQAVLDMLRPTIVHQGENYIVMNKPGGIDVLSNPDAHRVVNSLPGIAMEILSATNAPQTNTKTIIPAHRIDNPVSGLVCCGRSNKDAKRLSRKIESRDTVKTYLARVKVTNNRAFEILKSLPFEINIPLGFDTSISYAVVDVSKGKASRTSILAVMAEGSLDDGTFVIAVRPHTGRKHQLRKHLAHVGLPIANDSKYNIVDDVQGCSFSPTKISAFGLPNPPNQLIKLYENHYLDHSDHCKYVRRLLKQTTENLNSETGPSVNQPIWLHSWRYRFPSLGLSFEAPPPEWAQVNRWKITSKWCSIETLFSNLNLENKM